MNAGPLEEQSSSIKYSQEDSDNDKSSLSEEYSDGEL
jgi:hypothetical protein